VAWAEKQIYEIEMRFQEPLAQEELTALEACVSYLCELLQTLERPSPRKYASDARF
jgi:hypothetical protein